MANDSLKLDDIYAEHAQTVYRYLLSLCRNDKVAEELTQETFYQAIRSINKYDGSCKLSVWLCQIAKHMWYQHLRKEEKRALPLESVAEPASASLEDELIQRERSHELHVAIHQLEEPYREVVYLRALGGMSFKQIGSVVGQSETWARVTYFRARKQLIERIQKNETEL